MPHVHPHGHREAPGGDDTLLAPLYLDLRDLPPRDPGQPLPTLEGMMEHLCRMAGFGEVKVSALLAMVRAGYLALIFDGFDELAASLNEAQGDYLLREIRRAEPPGSKGKVLISSRTHYFIDRANEEEKIGGGVRTVLTRDGYSIKDCNYSAPDHESGSRGLAPWQVQDRVLVGFGAKP
ncbi:MAG: hypothetical protein HQL63_05860 [Magnetococcales bacterium]|nr:hypothetical protein [Magnetococcales bacterium]MBF0322008.1 hypothetical protein [Magnetococcales bacterium]